jgi:hypothetical protein
MKINREYVPYTINLSSLKTRHAKHSSQASTTHRHASATALVGMTPRDSFTAVDAQRESTTLNADHVLPLPFCFDLLNRQRAASNHPLPPPSREKERVCAYVCMCREPWMLAYMLRLLLRSSKSLNSGVKSPKLGTVVLSHISRYFDDFSLALLIHSCHWDGYCLRIAASDVCDTIARGSKK